MRMLRSLVCAGLAMIAVSLCASMPATAAPIELGVRAEVSVGKDYPAPVSIVVHDEIALPACANLAVVTPTIGRSYLAATGGAGIASAFNISAYRHIDPDIAG